MTNELDTILHELYGTIRERMNADSKRSYVAALNEKGLHEILKKVGEEATEVVIAAAAEQDHDLVSEVADLWFHSLVLLAHKNIRPHAVLSELKQRQGVSGLDEKAARCEK